jgi:hypothetical protein
MQIIEFKQALKKLNHNVGFIQVLDSSTDTASEGIVITRENDLCKGLRVILLYLLGIDFSS